LQFASTVAQKQEISHEIFTFLTQKVGGKNNGWKVCGCCLTPMYQ